MDTSVIIGAGIAFLALLGTLIGFIAKFSRDYGRLEEQTNRNAERIKENGHNTGELWHAFRGQVTTCNGQRNTLLVAMGKLETTVETLVESSKQVQTMLQGIQEEIYSIRGEK